MKLLPDIDGLQGDPESAAVPRRENPRVQSKSYSFLGGIVIAIALSAIISLVITFNGREKILEAFGVKPAPNPIAALSVSVQDLKDQVTKLSEDFEGLRQAQSNIKTEFDTAKFKDDKLTSRIENLERFSSGLEQRIEQQKKQVVQAQKVQAKPQPKPQPIIPISLVSIRNMSGTPYVSVRDGLDNSGLMMPGDAWHSWTFVDADPGNKTAMFMVNGARQELRL